LNRGGERSITAKLVWLIAGVLTLLLVGLFAGLSTKIPLSSGVPPQIIGVITAIAFLYLPVAHCNAVGSFGNNARQRVRNRALGFALGFASIMLGYVICIMITVQAYDKSLLLLAAVLMAAIAYSGVNLWRRIADFQRSN
jgi:cytochrome c biogenesis protein CcdA